MAALYRRGRFYYAQFYDKSQRPVRKRLSLKTTRSSEARRRLAALEKNFHDGLFDPWTDEYDHLRDRISTPDISLEDAADLFIKRKKQAGRRENTLRTYSEIVRLLMKLVAPGRSINSLKIVEVNSFVHAPNLSDATRFKRYSHLRTFIRFCLSERLLSEDIMSRMDAPRKSQKLPKSITDDELMRICDFIVQDYQVKREKGLIKEGEKVWAVKAFEFAYLSGLRLSEISRLKWEHIDFDKSILYIYQQKNAREQVLPLSIRALAVLKSVDKIEDDNYVFGPQRRSLQPRSIRYFSERLSRTFRDGRRGAGITRNINFHGLRHAFCTRLALNGKSAFIIQAAARHADIATSQRYVHINCERLREELDDVFES